MIPAWDETMPQVLPGIIDSGYSQKIALLNHYNFVIIRDFNSNSHDRKMFLSQRGAAIHRTERMGVPDISYR